MTIIFSYHSFCTSLRLYLCVDILWVEGRSRALKAFQFVNKTLASRSQRERERCRGGRLPVRQRSHREQKETGGEEVMHNTVYRLLSPKPEALTEAASLLVSDEPLTGTAVEGG